MVRPAIPHLSSAPITEALIDIRVKARPGFKAEEFLFLKAGLADRFPKIEDRRSGSITFQFPSSREATIFEDHGLQGYFFKSSDDKLVAQFRIDGFTLNRLRPYTSWKELLPIVTDLWSLYCKIAKPIAVTRIALRYINQIPFPSGPEDYNKYMRVPLSIPPELPQTVTEFAARMVIQCQHPIFSTS